MWALILKVKLCLCMGHVNEFTLSSKRTMSEKT
jgi:hypothetical protein